MALQIKHVLPSIFFRIFADSSFIYEPGENFEGDRGHVVMGWQDIRMG